MNLLHYIKQAFHIFVLNKKAIREVAGDKNALVPGIIFSILGSVVAVYVQYLNEKVKFALYLYVPVFF